MRAVATWLVAAIAGITVAGPLGREAAKAEGMDRLTFLGYSVKKTIEFSYYLDVCGNPAGGAQLRKLALRKLAACEASASPTGLLSREVEMLSRQMIERMQACDADADCNRGRQLFCPRVSQSSLELAEAMREAGESDTMLDRLVGGCS